MEDSLTLNNLKRRAKAPKPKFWKKVQKIAGVAGLIAGGILTLPVALPAAVITAATVAASIAGTAVAVAEFTTEGKKGVNP